VREGLTDGASRGKRGPLLQPLTATSTCAILGWQARITLRPTWAVHPMTRARLLAT